MEWMIEAGKERRKRVLKGLGIDSFLGLFEGVGDFPKEIIEMRDEKGGHLKEGYREAQSEWGESLNYDEAIKKKIRREIEVDVNWALLSLDEIKNGVREKSFNGAARAIRVEGYEKLLEYVYLAVGNTVRKHRDRDVLRGDLGRLDSGNFMIYSEMLMHLFLKMVDNEQKTIAFLDEMILAGEYRCWEKLVNMCERLDRKTLRKQKKRKKKSKKRKS